MKLQKNKYYFISLIGLTLIISYIMGACMPVPMPVIDSEESSEKVSDNLIFGMLMVGSHNDRGWSESHYNAAIYAEQTLPGAQFIYIDRVNPADRPGQSITELAVDLVEQGANVVIFNSDDMKAAALEFSKAYPEIQVIHATGDSSWIDGKNYVKLDNLTNVMGRIEYVKMIAGCAAALTTRTGKIGYLGPLINEETRRLASSAYLGAKYCWDTYRKPKTTAGQLTFKVEWIGFWFNIPGVTLDPTTVASDFYSDEFDVVISGIDTTEALIEAQSRYTITNPVWAIPFDYNGACSGANNVCLGVPYFNWGPFYAQYLTNLRDGVSGEQWNFLGPDWSDLNNPDSSHVGFEKGQALTAENSRIVDQFITLLADGLNLWTGPLKYQDGTEFLAKGEQATDSQIWYLEQLLFGMQGNSYP
jgi:simple sugar transport system substrate-binding protein